MKEKNQFQLFGEIQENSFFVHEAKRRKNYIELDSFLYESVGAKKKETLEAQKFSLKLRQRFSHQYFNELSEIQLRFHGNQQQQEASLTF